MCTVTVIARRRGYLLGMNRDEQRARVQGLPPQRHRLGNREALFPSEPGGGTWIGVNDLGVTIALINWYSVNARVAGAGISRGEIAKTGLACDSPDLVDRTLATFGLPRVNPFRLIGVFPAAHAIVEWRWNLQRLERIHHSWRTNTWISSGFDEAGVQQTRGKIFREALARSAFGLDHLRRLHCSHSPEPGPYSHCMHRDDAVTVSYTEVAVSSRSAMMRYAPGAPCGSRLAPPLGLQLVH